MILTDPKNIEEAIDIINGYFELSAKEEQDYFNESATDEIMYEYHQGLGRKIRNAWLWPKEDNYSCIYKHIHEKTSLEHPDDMSGFLLKLFWIYKHDKSKTLIEHKEKLINELIIKNIIE